MTDVPQQPPQPPPGSPYQAPPSAPPPGWGQGQPAPAYGAPATPNMLQTTPPRVLMALALVLAGAIHVLGVLITLITIDTDGFMNRLAFSFDAVDLRVLFLIPLVLLLVRGFDDTAAPVTGMGRLAVMGATVLAAVFTVFCVLSLIADLGADFFDNDTKAATFFFDVARVVAALGGTWWAFRELQKAGGIPAGMPGGPPAAPTAQTTVLPPQQPGWQQPGPPPAPPVQ
jgi:hypothetical protein